MAVLEQLKVLGKGVKEWNNWRSEHRDISIDLSGADLRQFDLRGADLNKANLTGIDFSRPSKRPPQQGDPTLSDANLVSCDLTRSRLNGASLHNAQMDGANLQEADLSQCDLVRTSFVLARLDGVKLNRANLRDSNLRESKIRGAEIIDADLKTADLRYADLSGTDLTRTTLVGTNFSGAQLVDVNFLNCVLHLTVLDDLDLSGASGLDSCRHIGPSVLSHLTLVRSGPLPLVFLRGCGLPDILIEYLPSLRGTGPIQFYSCFISYSTKDQEFAARLHADLQDKGVRCWFAAEDLKIGDPFRQCIDDAIRLHEKLLLILSEHSVNSSWVRNEVEAAFEREQRENRLVLFPIKLDDAVTDTGEAWAASIRRERHIGDFGGWKNHDAYKKGLDRLLRDLNADAREGARA